MGRRDDSSLNAIERAALACLEAKAAAEDPALAGRLRGASRFPVIAYLRRTGMGGSRGWCGAPLILVGLILAALSLSTTWVMGVVGSLITAWGLWMVAAAVERRRPNAGSSGLI